MTTSNLNRVTEQALTLSTAATIVDLALHTTGALCRGIDTYGFDTEVSRSQLRILRDLVGLANATLAAAPTPTGNLAGLDDQMRDAIDAIDQTIDELIGVVAFTAEPTDGWADQLTAVSGQLTGVARKIEAALTLADAPIHGSIR